MTDATARETLERALDCLHPAELQVLAFVAQGLLTGQHRFGPLWTNKRAWAMETAEELRDAVVYLLAGQLEQAGRLPSFGEVTK